LTYSSHGFVTLVTLVSSQDKQGRYFGPPYLLGSPSVPVISAQLSHRLRIAWRYADADSNWRLGRECWAMGL